MKTKLFLIGTAVGLVIIVPIFITPTANYRPPVGSLNPNVTQLTIGSTICISGWTRTLRPSVNYTTGLKIKQMKQRHLPGTIKDYDEDHFIPLELGGAPKDPKNLWPEKWNSARTKDQLENSLKAQVCKGSLTLAEAQKRVKDEG